MRRAVWVVAAPLALAIAAVWLISALVRDEADLTADWPVAPASAMDERVRVEVLNGGGRPGAARSVTTLLRDTGFDVVYFGNAASFEYDSSRVVDRVGDAEKASAVARALGIGNVLSEPDPNLYVDVSVVVGADWDGRLTPDAPVRPERGRRWWDPRSWLRR